jgi:hypothetical protein
MGSHLLSSSLPFESAGAFHRGELQVQRTMLMLAVGSIGRAGVTPTKSSSIGMDALPSEA